MALELGYFEGTEINKTSTNKASEIKEYQDIKPFYIDYKRNFKNDLKIGSKLWSRDEDRMVTVFESQYQLTQDEQHTTDYDNLSAVIEARPDDIIKDITAFGIFSIHITL